MSPFQSIYRLKKVCWSDVEERTPLLTPEEVVERIFQLVDENGDGECWMAQAAGSSPELSFDPGCAEITHNGQLGSVLLCSTEPKVSWWSRVEPFSLLF